MNACISLDHGYVVNAFVVEQNAPTLDVSDYGHYVPVVKFESQSDAKEFRDLLQRDGINENRLKLFIKNYDGRPKRIILGRKDSHGEPVLQRVSE